jgi:ribose/xylose/arabinose/galactoside ABC-type transport system permease subunit
VNPLELRGPEFLAFYWALAVATWLLLALARRVVESGRVPRLPPPERAVTGTPLDQVVLDLCRGGADAGDVARSDRAVAACEPYRLELERLRLLPDERLRAWRRAALAVAGGGLLVLAAATVGVGLARGRPVAFLVISAVIVALVTLRLTRGSVRTFLGDRLLGDLRSLFDWLQSRRSSLRPGGPTDEALLLAAVYGMGALPADHFPYAARPAPRRASSSTCSGGWTCSGGSCGGGGDGGGCGGCGGGGD